MLVGLVLSGCPVFSSSSDCWYDSDCAPGFVCRQADGECMPEANVEPEACTAPQDCSPGETCNSEALCVPGDCTFSGCVAGFECGVQGGLWTCIDDSLASGGAAGQAGAAGQGGAG